METIRAPIDAAATRPAIAVLKTPTACAGAVASYVLLRIAYRAGAFAPGIDDAIFHELHEVRAGYALADVERWFARRRPHLHDLGYRVELHRVSSPTAELLAWIAGGRGYRGAVVATSYTSLHPPAQAGDTGDVGKVIAHAIGVTSEAREPGADDELVMIDPWSRTGDARAAIAPALDLARMPHDHRGIAVHWVGWS